METIFFGDDDQTLTQVGPSHPLPVAVTGGIGGIAGAVTVADGADIALGTKADAANATTVIGQLKQLVVNTAHTSPTIYFHQKRFTTNGIDTQVDCTAYPPQSFTLQVTGTNGSTTDVAATSWTVLLRGSVDGINWQTLLTHSNGAPTTFADGALTSVANAPVRYLRLDCPAVTLGAATDILASVVTGH